MCADQGLCRAGRELRLNSDGGVYFFLVTFLVFQGFVVDGLGVA